MQGAAPNQFRPLTINEKLANFQKNFPKYYDKPEGEDVVGKLVYMNTNAFIFGSGYGLYDIVMFSKNLRTFDQKLFRYLQFALPPVGMATAWTFLTQVTTKLRGEEGYLNYIPGSLIAGGIFGRVFASQPIGWTAGFIITLGSFAKKRMRDEGWTFFHVPKPDLSPQLAFIDADYTLQGDGEKGWVEGSHIGDQYLKKA